MLVNIFLTRVQRMCTNLPIPKSDQRYGVNSNCLAKLRAAKHGYLFVGEGYVQSEEMGQELSQTLGRKSVHKAHCSRAHEVAVE